MTGQYATYRDCHHITPSWDPEITLRITNPDRGTLTCVGIAPSCKRRCRNPINQANRASAYGILRELEQLTPRDATIRARLRKLAGYTLCLRNHQNQVDSVVDGWMRDIACLSKTTKSSVNIKREPEETETDRMWRKVAAISEVVQSPKMQALLASLLEEMKKEEEEGRGDGSRDYRQGSGYEDEYEDERAEERRRARQRRTETKRQQAERKEKDRLAEESRQREERREEERQRAEQEARERVERKRREKERIKREQEETKRREETERLRRETEERNERVRQRAQNMRKEKERLAKQKSEMEKEEMAQSWLRYVGAWELVKSGMSGSLQEIRKKIPWPVKSGKFEDVNEQNVEEFYRKAIPDQIDAKKMVTLLNMECKKWHTDRIPTLYGFNVEVPLSDPFKLIVRVTIKLRTEAQNNRTEKC